MMTVLAYVAFIINIVMITKMKEVYGGATSIYPAVAVAALVCATLQMVYMLVYWFASKRALFSVLNVIIATAFFACFYFGAVVAMTVKRHDYCPYPLDGAAPNSGKLTGMGSPSDCQGVMRGTMGMTWAAFIWCLIHIGITAGLVPENKHDGASMSTPVGKIPLPPVVAEKEVV